MYNPLTNDHDYFNSIQWISTFVKDVYIYITGFVVKKVEIKKGLKASIYVQTIWIETEKIFRKYLNDFMN